jgi:hypothetical protein
MLSKLSRVGSIYGDLGLVAANVERACTGTSIVWADDVGDVFVSALGTREIASRSIVGIFTFGASIPYIQDDLQAMRSERARQWIVDA